MIDYWPDSGEAVAAGYLIGKTYKDMGEVKQAKKFYTKLLSEHAGSLMAILAKIDLADLARAEGDEKRRLALWNEVVFRTDRKGDAAPYCADISNQLATHFFSDANFVEGLKALATTYTEPQQPTYVHYYIRGPLAQLVAQPDSKPRGLKMADAAVAFVKSKFPAAAKDDVEKGQLRQDWYYIAEIEQYAGRATEALAAYDAVIGALGADDDTLGRKAGLLKALGRRDEARGLYARLQNQPEGQHQTAYSYREEQKWDQAIAIYQQLVSSDAKNGGRWNWELASTYRDAGRFKEAIGVFRLCDNFPEDLKQMAACHRRLGESKEALVLYQQIMAHAPSAPARCWRSRGRMRRPARRKPPSRPCSRSASVFPSRAKPAPPTRDCKTFTRSTSPWAAPPAKTEPVPIRGRQAPLSAKLSGAKSLIPLPNCCGFRLS